MLIVVRREHAIITISVTCEELQPHVETCTPLWTSREERQYCAIPASPFGRVASVETPHLAPPLLLAMNLCTDRNCQSCLVLRMAGSQAELSPARTRLLATLNNRTSLKEGSASSSDNHRSAILPQAAPSSQVQLADMAEEEASLAAAELLLEQERDEMNQRKEAAAKAASLVSSSSSSSSTTTSKAKKKKKGGGRRQKDSRKIEEDTERKLALQRESAERSRVNTIRRLREKEREEEEVSG